MSTEGMNAADEASQGWRARLRAAWDALTGRAPAAGRVTAARASNEVSTAAARAVIDAVIGGIPAPTIVLDRDGKVLAFNAPAAGIAPALRSGEPALITLRMPEVVDAIRRVSATGERQRVEYVQRVPLERWFEVFVCAVSMPPGEGQPGRDMLVMTFNDLTPLRRVEEMRADFVANASHELRTPLAALSGFIETLQGPAKDDAPARERFLAIMRSQAARMARLIDDLLSLSRIELNAHLRPSTPVDMAPMLKQVVDGLQMLARERNVEIRIDAPPEPLTVLGDRDELVRALENLVENALKYGANGKRVEVALSRGTSRDGADEVRVAVRDHGPGIAPEHLPRLTERFYRVDVAGSRAQGGTGLGLALVKHVLNRHGGRLNIESAPGAGATFTLHLPLHPAAGA
jgi:two-component system phosphate regulon sensor histidine kinase PhoR